MYGLPENFDSAAFVDTELVQIAFSANTIDFWFGENISITLMSSFIHRIDSNKTEGRHTVPVTESGLMALIGKSVSSASADRDGTLILLFENGDSLTFLDDSKQYESYSIQLGGERTIV